MKFIKPNPSKIWKVPVTASIADNKPLEYHDYVYNHGEDRPVSNLIYDQATSKWIEIPPINIQRWVDNFVFHSTLIMERTYRGRSAAGFKFKDKDSGALLTMRLKKTAEFIEAIADGTIKVVDGGFEGDFTFFKQGANWTIGVYVENAK